MSTILSIQRAHGDHGLRRHSMTNFVGMELNNLAIIAVGDALERIESQLYQVVNICHQHISKNNELYRHFISSTICVSRLTLIMLSFTNMELHGHGYGASEGVSIMCHRL